jgi:hypothetical protein
VRLFAYLDPGSASALLAAVLAGIAGIGAALRTYGKDFLSKLMFWKKSEPAGEQSETPGDSPPAGVAQPADTAAAETAEDDPVETPAEPPEADGSPGQ